MKINQQTVDAVMFGKAGCHGEYSDYQTLTNVRNAIGKNFNVQLSNTEAHEFWRWRSDKYDANFLVCEDPKTIAEWFEIYIMEWWGGDDQYDDYPAPYEITNEEGEVIKYDNK